MKTMEITLDYSQEQGTGVSEQTTPFPFRVLDASGVLLAEGAVSSRESTRIEFDDPDNNALLFVKLLWPNGKATTRRAAYGDRSGAAVRFSDARSGVAEWAKWAGPRVASIANPDVSVREVETRSLANFGNVWLRLWRHSGQLWSLVDITPERRKQNELAKQVDLQLQSGSHLLQLGGAQMPWVFVSLPGDGLCRILLTPRSGNDPKGLPLKVVVTTFRPEAEMIVEFLSRDALRSAKTIGNFDPFATKLLHDKFDDPVSAIAGAYLLLRTGAWRATPPSWFENLYRLFPLSSDVALIRTVLSLRKGLSSPSETIEAVNSLSYVFDRGIPLFEEAHRLLIEAFTLLSATLRKLKKGGADATLQHLNPDDYDPLIERCRETAAARAWMGSAFAFYGCHPTEPSALRRRGAPPVTTSGENFDRKALEDLAPSQNLGFTMSARLPKPARHRASKKSVTYLKEL